VGQGGGAPAGSGSVEHPVSQQLNEPANAGCSRACSRARCHDRAIAGALTLAAAIGSAFVMIGTAELLGACAIGTMFALAITQITPAEASISHRLVVVGAGLAALVGGALLPHLVTSAWLDTGWKVLRVLLEAMVACRVALTIAFRTGYRPAPASP
jgi:hypothetical protein